MVYADRYLVIGCSRPPHGPVRVRIAKRPPSLDADEIAIKMEIRLPDALFKKPHLEAKIEVPNEAAKVEAITAITADNVRDAIVEATGLELSISVKQEDSET